jgi:sarcosine oxidase subunit delta
MLLISCPWCGPRDESEYSYGGEAHIVRPLDPDAVTDEQWADYLFFRKNPKGLHREQWLHAFGCRRWFYVVRDTVTYKIHAIYKVGDELPPLEPTDAAGTIDKDAAALNKDAAALNKGAAATRKEAK